MEPLKSLHDFGTGSADRFVTTPEMNANGAGQELRLGKRSFSCFHLGNRQTTFLDSVVLRHLIESDEKPMQAKYHSLLRLVELNQKDLGAFRIQFLPGTW